MANMTDDALVEMLLYCATIGPFFGCFSCPAYDYGCADAHLLAANRLDVLLREISHLRETARREGTQ